MVEIAVAKSMADVSLFRIMDDSTILALWCSASFVSIDLKLHLVLITDFLNCIVLDSLMQITLIRTTEF